MAKIDFATAIPTSYRLIGSISTFDYFKKDKLFSRNNKPAFNQKDERFLKLQVGLPFLSSKRAEFGVGIARIEDKYFQKSVIDFGNDKFDKSRYDLFVVTGRTSFARIESFFSNENLGYKGFSVSTCRILFGIKSTSIKTN